MNIFDLKINGLRNLSNVDLQFSSNFNLFFGHNGSGKTSLLESIYLLGFGRSFRSTQLNTLIDYQAPSFSVFTHASDSLSHPQLIGLEKNRNCRFKIKINGEAAKNIGQIAKIIPIQILCPDSFQLLTSGPEGRRQFLDWGVFHVEHSFFDVWLKYTRALRQRSSILREKTISRLEAQSQLGAWDKELSSLGSSLTAYRKKYISTLLIKFRIILKTLLPLENIEFFYYQGWEETKTLEQALKDSMPGDLKAGFTRVGPQRADLICTINNLLVGQVLSRGQQKLFVCALILAQGAVIFDEVGKKCIYLVDDLASELDEQGRRAVIEHIALSGSQAFITGIEVGFLKSCILGFEHKMFHVEHGRIK